MILTLRSMIFIGISTWTWCYALWSSIAIPHELDATLYESSLAFPHDLDATLYDLHWHFHMNLMLRSMIFNCNSTWSWCYALWSSLVFPHEPDATLYDLQLQFHTSASDSRGGVGWDNNVIGNSTWTWCYALWSSIAIPHDLDATLYDLHWHFHMNLMLRSMIFNCNSTHPHPIAWGGVGWGGITTSLAFPHELDATLYDLQCEKKLRLPFLRLKWWKGCHSQSRRTFFW